MQEPDQKWGHLDSAHIDVNRPDELAYWTKAFEIDERTLIDVVTKVGPSLAAIKLCLNQKAD